MSKLGRDARAFGLKGIYAQNGVLVFRTDIPAAAHVKRQQAVTYRVVCHHRILRKPVGAQGHKFFWCPFVPLIQIKVNRALVGSVRAVSRSWSIILVKFHNLKVVKNTIGQ